MFPLRDDNPTTITPFLTVTLIAINVLVFMYQVSLGPRGDQMLLYQYGAIPAVVLGDRALPSSVVAMPPAMTLFTSMFLHGGIMHLLGNMLYLWIFGNNIEEAMGRVRFLLFYLLTGVVASLAHVLSNPNSTLPSIGASGAISGVLGASCFTPGHACLTLLPRAFFIRLMYIPAGWVLGIWFALQLFSGSLAGQGSGGGVAFWAHIGGFVAGMALVGLFKRRDVRFFNPPAYHPSMIENW